MQALCPILGLSFTGLASLGLGLGGLHSDVRMSLCIRLKDRIKEQAVKKLIHCNTDNHYSAFFRIF